ncbi:MAG TPA: dephospho-CoA kinase [Sphingobacteriaceae bacterium]
MLKVGVTGGIGSGKTTVCKIFEVLDVPVFYADEAAKTVMITDEILISGIRQHFGDSAYSVSGVLNRKYLADIVFNSTIELEKLNSLVHPAVFRAFDRWVNDHKNSPYVIKEAALLFESNSYKLCDYTILVKSPSQLRIQRVMDRDSVLQSEVELRMNKQFSDEKKETMADFIITNNENELVIPQVLSMHSKFLAMTQE